jgi:hypothetical protein
VDEQQPRLVGVTGIVLLIVNPAPINGHEMGGTRCKLPHGYAVISDMNFTVV